MKYHHTQPGLTSTPNSRQSFGARLKATATQMVTIIKNILIGREQSLQPKTWCRGFSLIETVVAITILLIVIVGPMSITSSTARSTGFASDQVTAFFLAQEGAELVQKVRDDYLLRQFLPPSNSQYLSNPWSQFIRTSGGVQLQNCYTNDGCAIEIDTGTTGAVVPNILPRCQSSACQLYYDDSENIRRSRYTHTATNASITPFTREVRLTIINDYEVRVVSEVTWRSGLTSAEQSVSVVNHLFNIYAN